MIQLLCEVRPGVWLSETAGSGSDDIKSNIQLYFYPTTLIKYRDKGSV